MTKFEVGDKVKTKYDDKVYTVTPLRERYKDSAWATRANTVNFVDEYGNESWAYLDQIEHVIIIVDGQRYIQRKIPEYGLCLIPFTPDVNKPPVGSLWKGIKGGRYVVINTEGDAFDFNTQKVYKLPKTAVFVAHEATSVTVSHKEGQL